MPLRKIWLLGAILFRYSRNRLRQHSSFHPYFHHQDAAAQKVLDEFIRHLAVGLTNIIFIFDCEVISISSEILSSLPYCLPEVMRSMILPITHAEKVVLSRLGKNGAILGAAGQAIETFFQDLANTEPPAPSDT